MKFQLFKKKEKKPVSKSREWFNSITFAVVAATLIRWTTVEAFVIPTPSMEDTAIVGDFLFVSKFHYGTRLTGTPLQIPLTHQKIWGTNIPSYVEWVKLPPYRFPGISEVKRGDVVVFNVPPPELSEDRQSHPISLKSNYVKRCIAIAGDKIEIRDRQVFINGEAAKNAQFQKWSYIVTSKEQISDKNMKRFGFNTYDYYFAGMTDNKKAVYRILLTQDQLAAVKSTSYIESVVLENVSDKTPEGDIFPNSKYSRWNGNNYGPLVIPKKGMKIAVNDSTIGLYGETISLYEHNTNPLVENGKLFIDGEEITEYTFKQDHYFMMGDNRNNSLDSRYWGFVPYDHIVGKALFVWMSVDEEADMLNKIRWSRLFDVIE